MSQSVTQNKIQNLSLMARLSAVECRDSTYKPKTSSLVFAKAKGSLVWDADGSEYIDLCAGFGALPLGHNAAPLLEVAAFHLEDMPSVEHAMGDVYPSVEKILFLETLRNALPKAYTKGALALSGGQAVELALKTAMLRTRKFGFLVFDDAYHGLDLGVLPLTARSDFREPFESWLSKERVLRLPYGSDTQTVSEVIAKLEKTVGFAAIVAEPLQGRAGVNPPRSGWLEELAHTAHEHGGLLILDEVFTGFGRIGSITSSETVDADILCFGKAIGGGFPISACFAKEDVMNAWPESPGEALHTGTFFGHPFSAAVGRRTMEEISKQNLPARSTSLGEEAKIFLREHLKDSPLVKDIRGQGLMIGIEFTKPGYGALLMDELRSHGLIVLPSGSKGEVLSITPALNIEKELLLRALTSICQFVLNQKH